MALLADYTITPDVFDIDSYSNEEVCRLHLREISSVMRTEGVVRDLHAGEWRALLKGEKRRWQRLGKELVKKLETQGRLISSRSESPAVPIDDIAWCEEALASHARLTLTGGIIVTGPIKDKYQAKALVAPVDRLDGAAWWNSRSPAIRLQRKLAEYRRQLDLVLRCANSIQFIDPYLHPAKERYQDFADLLSGAGSRTPAPHVEIHRVCYEGSGQQRRVLDFDQLEDDFRQTLGERLQATGLQAKVFVWDDFHDRYLISNLIGILLPNGFDTSCGKDLTTWTRIGPRERDDVQREFDPASGHHHLHRRFRIP